MKIILKTIVIFAVIFTLLSNFSKIVLANPGDYNIIYNIPSRSGYGEGMIEYNNRLYVFMAGGGSFGQGELFTINLDGTGYISLHSFGSATDGYSSYPQPPIQYNDKLYGVTQSGGANGKGTVFSIDSNGANYTALHDFCEELLCADGGIPVGAPIIYNNKLYGTVTTGGVNDGGLLYVVDLDGSNYSILHSFNKTGMVRDYPCNTITVSDGSFYGVTGNSNLGNGIGQIYSINPNGTNYNVLHTFSHINDGRIPSSALNVYNGQLYGTTQSGGSSNAGVIYTMHTDGSNYNVLHSFIGASDGGYPWGGLTPYGAILYGTTEYDGVNGYGTFYSINPDGSNFQILHSFPDVVQDGGNLNNYGNVLIHENKAYLITDYLGLYGSGVISTYELPDITPPSISNILPVNNAILLTKTPLLTFNLNESGSCRASLIDESYDSMNNGVDCTGDGTTNMSCQIPDLGANGAKNIYLACSDGLGNSDTSETNTLVAYTLNISVKTKPISIPTPQNRNPTPLITDTVVPTVTPNIPELQETVTITPIDMTFIYTVQDKNGVALPNITITIDGAKYIADSKGQIKLNIRLTENSKITYVYNGKLVSVKISETTIILQLNESTTDQNYWWLFLLLVAVIACGCYGFYTVSKRKTK